MASRTTCPRCGLAVFSAENVPPPEVPTCNPHRSPECWSVVAALPKADSPERRVITEARRRGVNRG